MFIADGRRGGRDVKAWRELYHGVTLHRVAEPVMQNGILKESVTLTLRSL